MKRWFKRIRIFLGIIVSLFVLFVIVEHVRGWWSLNRRLKQLKAQGEDFSVAHLTPKRLPADQNAYLDLEVLTNQIATLLTNLNDVPPSLRFAAPGKGIVAWRLKEWSIDKKTTNDWSRMGPAIEHAQELFAKIHTILQKPAFDSGFDYGRGFPEMYLPSLVTVKQTAQLLSAAMIYELNERHIEAAHERLCDLTRLACCQTPEALLILQLVRQACFSFALNDTWEALQDPVWSESQLAELQSVWEKFDLPPDLALAMEMERAMNLDYYAHLKNSHAHLEAALKLRENVDEMTEGAFGDALGSLPTHGFILHWVHAPLWQIAWADQDALFSLNRWQAIIHVEKEARSNSWLAVSQLAHTEPGDNPFLPMLGQSEQLGWYDRLRFLFANETFSVNDIITRRTLEHQTEQQMAIAVIAINRYQLLNGALPKDLTVLVPRFLKTLPRDYIDGKTLRYQLRPPDNFSLYSAGEDGKDDDGDPMPTSKKNYTRIWDGCDALWPIPATDAEAAAAFKSTNGQF